jgi:4-hydroxy-3-methylbut-2-enyl diphosphate reductase
LIDGADDIDVNWLQDVTTIGVTAGASAPEVLVENVVAKLVELGASRPRELEGVVESIEFSLPRELRA